MIKTYKVIEYKDCTNCAGLGFNVSSRSGLTLACGVCGGARITRTEVDLKTAIIDLLGDMRINLEGIND